MNRRILASLDNFKKIRDNNSLYVDKSGFISELLEFGDEVVAIARPRRFGKSLNMSMLSYFFDMNNSEENKKLFEGLEIAKSPHFAEQGKYVVVSIAFKDFKKSSFKDCYSKIVKLIISEYDKHPYLQNSTNLTPTERRNYEKILNGRGDQSDYESSLGDLSRYLNKHHGRKVVILIDEYDTPVIDGELNGYYEKVSNFMQNFLGEALKSNESIFKGIVTGITRLQGAGIFSGLNNADICTTFEKKYNDKFGFTEKEVKDLLREYDMEDKEFKVKDYYNGYNFKGEVIYNPYSVVKSLGARDLGNFWIGSSSNDLAKKKIRELMNIRVNNGLNDEFEQLLQGGVIKLNVKNSQSIGGNMDKEDILNLLLHSGYLKYKNYRIEGFKRYAEASIPNQELREVYSETVGEWLREKAPEYTGEKFMDFLKQICEGDEKNIKEVMEIYLDKRSMFDGEKILEMGYHNFLFGMLQGLESRYIVESNKESSKGRFDIMLTPVNYGEKENKNRSGIVIELKVGSGDNLKKLSEKAISQIEGNKYYSSLKEKGLKKARLVGIAFNKKNVEVAIKDIKLDIKKPLFD